MDEMMIAALTEAFGPFVAKAVGETIEPLIAEIKLQREAIATLYRSINVQAEALAELVNAQNQLLAVINRAKSNGGMASRLLGIG